MFRLKNKYKIETKLFKFFIYYNVLYLGTLLLILLFLGSILINARTQTGTWWAWEYGFLTGFFYLLTLGLSFFSWAYGVYRTTLLTRPLNRLNLIKFLPLMWLISVPIVIILTTKFWIKIAQKMTFFIFNFIS